MTILRVLYMGQSPYNRILMRLAANRILVGVKAMVVSVLSYRLQPTSVQFLKNLQPSPPEEEEEAQEVR